MIALNIELENNLNGRCMMDDGRGMMLDG